MKKLMWILSTICFMASGMDKSPSFKKKSVKKDIVDLVTPVQSPASVTRITTPNLSKKKTKNLPLKRKRDKSISPNKKKISTKSEKLSLPTTPKTPSPKKKRQEIMSPTGVKKTLFFPSNDTKIDSKSNSPVAIVSPKMTFPAVFFSPGTNIGDMVINLMDHEKEQIDATFYRFTRFDIAKKLVDKKEKDNVMTTLIVDKDYKKDSKNALKLLAERKVSVLVFNSPLYFKNNPSEKPENGHFTSMHSKTILFKKNGTNNDGRLLLTGSWNATGQGSNNIENATVLADKKLIKKYCETFLKLQNSSIPINFDKDKARKETSRILNRIPKKK